MINQKLNSRNVLRKTDELILELKSISDLKSLEKVHAKTLDLCRVVFVAKKNYKTIDISPPREIVFNIIGSKTKKVNNVIRSEFGALPKDELKKEIAKILQEIKRIYILKSELEK